MQFRSSVKVVSIYVTCLCVIQNNIVELTRYSLDVYYSDLGKIYLPHKIKSHQVATASMEPFDPKSTLKLRSVLHIRYSIFIR